MKIIVRIISFAVYLSFLTTQVFICPEAHIGAPGVDREVRSLLSPRLGMEAHSVQSHFAARFFDEKQLSTEKDELFARKHFGAGLFELNFSILFPVAIQKYIQHALERDMTPQTDGTDEASIHVRFQGAFDSTGAEDRFITNGYALFERIGLSKEGNISFSERGAVHEELIDIFTGYDRYGVGYAPPPWKWSGKQNIRRVDAYNRERFALAIEAITGSKNDERNQPWIKKPANILKETLYHQNKLPHVFGQKLMAAINSGGSAVFRVSIMLADGTVTEERVRIVKSVREIIAQRFVDGAEHMAQDDSDIASESPEPASRFSFDYINDPVIRRAQHVLCDPVNARNQITDFSKTARHYAAIRELRKSVVDVTERNFSPELTRRIRETLQPVYAWVEHTPMTGANMVAENIRVREVAEVLINANSEILALTAADSLADIANALHARLGSLGKSIAPRLERVRKYANMTSDRILALEAAKVLVLQSQGWLLAGRFSEAEKIFEQAQTLWEGLGIVGDLNSGLQNQSQRLLSMLSSGEQAQIALGSIQKVEAGLSRQARILQDIKGFMTERRFDRYPRTKELVDRLAPIIKALAGASQSATPAADVLKKTRAGLMKLGQAMDALAERDQAMESVLGILTSRLEGVEKQLGRISGMIEIRNQAIRTALPFGFSGMGRERILLELHRQAGALLPESIDLLYDDLNTLYLGLQMSQQENPDSLQPLKVFLPGVLGRLSKRAFRPGRTRTLVEQAI